MTSALQAAGLEPILRSKVRQWAAASNGRAGRQDSSEEGAARSRLKSVLRAVEKLVRSYDSDVSRLVGRSCDALYLLVHSGIMIELFHLPCLSGTCNARQPSCAGGCRSSHMFPGTAESACAAAGRWTFAVKP
jgi:hypothetical protein